MSVNFAELEKGQEVGSRTVEISRASLVRYAGRAANLGGGDLTQQLFSHVFKNTGLSRFIPVRVS